MTCHSCQTISAGNKLWVFLLIACLLVPLTCFSCAASQVIQIGAFIGLSDNIAVYGESQKKGIELAVEEINASALVGHKRQLEVIFADTGATPEGAVKAVRELIDNNVTGLIGPTLSSQALAADPLAQDHGIPVIAISNTVPGIVEIGDYVFRCSLPESSVMPGTVSRAAQQYNLKKVSILWGQDQELTVAGHQTFLAAASVNNLEILADLPYPTGETDLATLITAVIDSKPDAVCVSALAGDAVNIIVQIREQDYNGIVLGSNGFNSPDLIRQAGQAADGIIVGTAWDKDSELPANRAFISAYEKKFGSSPDQFAAQSYTAVYLFAGAIATSEKITPAALRNALAVIQDMATPLGDFSFDANREPVSSSVVQIVLNGEFVVFR